MIHVFAEWIYEDKGLVLVDSLQRHGFDAELETKLPKNRRFGRRSHQDDLWIGHFSRGANRMLPTRYVAMQTEPLWNAGAWWSEQPDFEPMLAGAREVWDYNESNRPMIERFGRHSTHVPCGYSPLFEQWHQQALRSVGEPDIDVLFVGGMVPRRVQALDAIRSSGLRVEVISYGDVVHGAALHRLIARSNLYLEMHRYDDPSDHCIDLFRFDHALSNGIPILHERVTPRLPFDEQFMDRIAFYDLDDVVGAVHQQLENPESTRSRAQRTRQWFADEVNIDRFIPFDRLQALLDAGTDRR